MDDLADPERCALASVQAEEVSVHVAALAPIPEPARTSLDYLSRWTTRELGPWLGRTSRALEAIDASARRAFDLACLWPSLEVLAARSRAYERVWEALMAIPVADELADEPGFGHDGSAAEPLWSMAVSSYEGCLALAREHRAFGPVSRRCTEALERFDRTRFPRHHELFETRLHESGAAPPPPARADEPDVRLRPSGA